MLNLKVEADRLDLGVGSIQDAIPASNCPRLDQDFELIGKIREAAEHLASFIPKLREARPAEYEAMLSEVFTGALQYDDQARIGYIKVLLNAVDHTLLSDYLDKFITRKHECITRKSPFRVRIETVLQKWEPKIVNRVCLFSPTPTAWSARRIQVSQLKRALITIHHGIDDAGNKTLLYPDNNLAKVVEHIATTGTPYFTSWGFDNGFNQFLNEMIDIYQLLCANKIAAHHDGFSLYDQDKLHMIKALAIGHQNLAQRLDSVVSNQERIAYAIHDESAATVNEYIDEIGALKKTIRRLETQVKCEHYNSSLLPVITDENTQLRREIARLEYENAKLKGALKKITPTQPKEIKKTPTEPAANSIKNSSSFIGLKGGFFDHVAANDHQFDKPPVANPPENSSATN